MPLVKLPNRVFLDSSTLQTLQDYGEYIYDGGEIAQTDKIWSIPDGFENIESLRKIMRVGQRGAFEFVLSQNSLREVLNKKDINYLKWAYEVLDYWEECIASYEDGDAFLNSKGNLLSTKLQGDNFGYLSSKDAALIRDALLIECDVFLTMEKKLPRNAQHLEKELKIKVLQPYSYWRLINAWF